MKWIALMLLLFLVQFKASSQSWGDSTLKDKRIFYKTEVAPKFPGGEKALYKFIKENSKLEVSKKALSTNKIVIAQIIIDQEGAIAFAEIVKGSDEKYNNEVIELIRKMPVWTPAYQNNHPVPIYVTLPFTFKE